QGDRPRAPPARGSPTGLVPLGDSGEGLGRSPPRRAELGRAGALRGGAPAPREDGEGDGARRRDQDPRRAARRAPLLRRGAGPAGRVPPRSRRSALKTAPGAARGAARAGLGNGGVGKRRCCWEGLLLGRAASEKRDVACLGNDAWRCEATLRRRVLKACRVLCADWFAATGALPRRRG